ncbi:YihY/virulence factor BrkB family protein [Porphyromonadaceae bacterium OttesenSCG-928-L07]|nr:YihY/virulence factor BrkB family protein [Porphyromonadaceae bacterium OttesenSCG-928-L07]MDL2251802.1 YihY/virulence factor BrkB family protein [Odoribacter sp. OttesenSCG-928-J03]MDL2330853.1 YihY/virulence factor BrkB family protein [Odoribacter sp. OttesenSCG-928-A06]
MKSVKLRKYISLEFYYAVLRTDLTKTTIWTHFLIKAVAVLVVSIHRFVKDKCTVSASALTFYSILSMIPIVALILGIARGFGVSKLLERQLQEQTFTNPAVMELIVNSANSALENVNSGIVTGIGIIFLMWSVLKVLGNIELAMNKIWGIGRGRNYKRQFTDYLSIMFVAPILIILISGMNVFLTSNLQDIAMEEGFLKYASSLIIRLLNFIPYVLVWLLFIFLYMFMPATKVRFKYAVVGGLLAGTVYQIVLWFYLRFQIGVSSYNAIYGSLAAFPLLLIWLQISWSVILWGTELSYIVKNRHFLFYNTAPESRWSEHVDRIINILRFIGSEYSHNKGTTSIGAISKKYKIGLSKLRILLGELVDKNILIEIKDDDDVTYLPLVDLHNLSVADIIVGLSNVDVEKSSEWEKKYVEAIYSKFADEKFL